MIVAILLKDSFSKIGHITAFTRVAANLTYYSHPLVVMALNMAFPSLFGIEMTETPTYILVCLITLMGSLAIYKADNRILSQLAP